MCKPESSAEDARFNGGTMTSGGESSLSLPPQSNGVFRLVIPYIPFLINLSKAAAYKTTCHEYCWIPFRFYLLLTCHAKLRHGPSLLVGQHLLRLIDLFVRCAHAMPFTLPAMIHRSAWRSAAQQPSYSLPNWTISEIVKGAMICLYVVISESVVRPLGKPQLWQRKTRIAWTNRLIGIPSHIKMGGRGNSLFVRWSLSFIYSHAFLCPSVPTP